MWTNSDIFDRASKVEYLQGDMPNANGVTRAITYQTEPYKNQPARAFAYIGIPNTPMPKDGYPAVVVAHGGGGCAFYEWIEYWNGKGFVAIAPDFYGNEYGSLTKKERDHCVGCIDEMPAGSFMNTAKEYRDSWTYHAVSNCILAYNVLRDTGKVNPEKIAMTGISWGSVVACIVSGVDKRFKAFGVVYGGGFVYETPCFEKDTGYISRKGDSEWIACFDPISYLPQNDKPTMFTFGADESCFSPWNNMRSARLCKGEVCYAVKESLFHSHRWNDDDEMRHIYLFINSVINGTPMPFTVQSAVLVENALFAKVDKPQSVERAKLVFTFSNLEEDSREWKWTSTPATRTNDSFMAEIPTSATAWFMEFTDNQANKMTEFIQSTEMFFRDEITNESNQGE